MSRRSTWNFWDRLGGVLILLAIIVTPIFTFGGKLEGYLFPVTTPAHIISAAPYGTDDNTMTLLSMEAKKIRDCDWLRTDWYLGERSGRAAWVPSRFGDTPELRQKGTQYWGLLFVSLPENLVRESSYALSTHRCHSLWRTISVYYDSEIDQ